MILELQSNSPLHQSDHYTNSALQLCTGAPRFLIL